MSERILASAARCPSLSAANRSASASIRCSIVLERLLLPAAELGDLRLRYLGGAVEILRPAGEALLDLGLNLGELRRERGGDRALLLFRDGAPLLCEPPLLLLEEGARVGARAGEGELELGRRVSRAPARRPRGDGPRLRRGARRSPRRRRSAPRGGGGRGGEEAHGQAGRRDGERAVVASANATQAPTAATPSMRDDASERLGARAAAAGAASASAAQRRRRRPAKTRSANVVSATGPV